jgi:hypothetical protein
VGTPSQVKEDAAGEIAHITGAMETPTIVQD